MPKLWIRLEKSVLTYKRMPKKPGRYGLDCVAFYGRHIAVMDDYAIFHQILCSNQTNASECMQERWSVPFQLHQKDAQEAAGYMKKGTEAFLVFNVSGESVNEAPDRAEIHLYSPKRGNKTCYPSSVNEPSEPAELVKTTPKLTMAVENYSYSYPDWWGLFDKPKSREKPEDANTFGVTPDSWIALAELMAKFSSSKTNEIEMTTLPEFNGVLLYAYHPEYGATRGLVMKSEIPDTWKTLKEAW